jgi:hypothetical protein
MEIIEIISHFINKDSNVIRVEFRCIGDNADTVRTDTLEYGLLQNYGYDDSISFDGFFDEYDEEEWDYEEDDEDYMDESDLLDFLNEYYVVEGKLPDAEYL